MWTRNGSAERQCGPRLGETVGMLGGRGHQTAGQAREDTARAAAAAATAAAAARGEEVVACQAQLGVAKVRVGARPQDPWENTQSV